MRYGIYELILYFFLYSFLGWCTEIAYAAVRHKKFMNRGFLNGPFCPVYGFGMVLVLIFFGPELDSFLFLALGCGAVAVVLEFFTGALMERVFHCKWWDYSGYKSNLGGYVCLPFSCLWGIAAAACITFLQPWLRQLFELLPLWVERTAAIVLSILCLLDFFAVSWTILRVQKNSRIEGFAAGMQKVSNKVGGAISRAIVKRMTKAFPNLTEDCLLYTSRDFYDIHILLSQKQPDETTFRAAFQATSRKRNAEGKIPDHEKILNAVKKSEAMAVSYTHLHSGQKWMKSAHNTHGLMQDKETGGICL